MTRRPTRARSTTSKARIDGHTRRWAAPSMRPTIGWATCGTPCRRTPSWSSCRSRCPPAGPPSTTAGRFTAVRPTSVPTLSAGRSSATSSPPTPDGTPRTTTPSIRATAGRAKSRWTRPSSPCCGATGTGRRGLTTTRWSRRLHNRPYRAARSAARDRGQDRHLVTVLDGGVEAVEEADVLAVDVDVDKAAQPAVLGDAAAQLAEALVERVKDLADGRPVDARGGLALGGGAKLGGDLHADGHGGYILCKRTDALVGRLEGLDAGIDLPRLERSADRVEGLEALAGDVGHHALLGVDVAALRQLGQHRGGHPAGGLGEDAGRLGQQPDALADLIVGDRLDRPAAA